MRPLGPAWYVRWGRTSSGCVWSLGYSVGYFGGGPAQVHTAPRARNDDQWIRRRFCAWFSLYFFITSRNRLAVVVADMLTVVAEQALHSLLEIRNGLPVRNRDR